MEKATPSPVVEEKSEASDGFLQKKRKPQFTNTTGKNQDQEESFCRKCDKRNPKSKSDNKNFLSGDLRYLENWFLLSFFCNGKRKGFKKRKARKSPK